MPPPVHEGRVIFSAAEGATSKNVKHRQKVLRQILTISVQGKKTSNIIKKWQE